jgi:ectoine hydroxylase-related dioxygenase (phytanoyl-CoA dioxygenase family)
MEIEATADQLAACGYAIVDRVVSDEIVAKTCAAIADLQVRAGTRRLLDALWCLELAEQIAREPTLARLMPSDAVPVQCTLFEKSARQNWLVSLHQDLSIPVAARVNSPLCSAWSEKEGELFVQPPITVLQQTLAVRLHLDDCGERNGALRVVPRSHCLGRLTSREAIQARDAWGEVVVSVPSGGAMLMRPLLLHASSKASIGFPRRVLHFVFGPRVLPEGLRWSSRNRSSPTAY